MVTSYFQIQERIHANLHKGEYRKLPKVLIVNLNFGKVTLKLLDAIFQRSKFNMLSPNDYGVEFVFKIFKIFSDPS